MTNKSIRVAMLVLINFHNYWQVKTAVQESELRNWIKKTWSRERNDHPRVSYRTYFSDKPEQSLAERRAIAGREQQRGLLRNFVEDGEERIRREKDGEDEKEEESCRG